MKNALYRPTKKPRSLLTEQQVIRQMKSLKNAGLTYAEMGAQLGDIPPQNICDMIMGRKPISDRVLKALGLRRVELYARESA